MNTCSSSETRPNAIAYICPGPPTINFNASPMADHPLDSGTDHLNADHQGVGEQNRPQHVESELCASLRIGGNSAGIVVSRACDESWAKFLEPRVFTVLGDGFRVTHCFLK